MIKRRRGVRGEWKYADVGGTKKGPQYEWEVIIEHWGREGLSNRKLNRNNGEW